MKKNKKVKKLILFTIPISIFLLIQLILAINPIAIEDKMLTKDEILEYIPSKMEKYQNLIIFKTQDKTIKEWLKTDALSFKNLGEINYYNYNSSKLQYYVYPEYTEVHLTISYKLNKKQMNYVKKNIKKIAKKCKGKNDKETIKNVNNYYKKYLSYKRGQNSIYVGLKKGNGNCYTYTMLTKMTLDELGIKNTTVYGSVNNGQHIWNRVKLGDKWKYLDVTFNDKLNDKYFLISKKQLLKTHKILKERI